jgi:hypothetical protein
VLASVGCFDCHCLTGGGRLRDEAFPGSSASACVGLCLSIRTNSVAGVNAGGRFMQVAAAIKSFRSYQSR